MRCSHSGNPAMRELAGVGQLGHLGHRGLAVLSSSFCFAFVVAIRYVFSNDVRGIAVMPSLAYSFLVSS